MFLKKHWLSDALTNNHIINCMYPYHDDAVRAHVIYGPDVAALKGKMTRFTPAARAPSYTAAPIPTSLSCDARYVYQHEYRRSLGIEERSRAM
jgi:hypothetical protein